MLHCLNSRGPAAFVAFLLSAWICPGSVYAGCVNFNSQANGIGVGSFNLSGSGIDPTVLGLAAGMWNSCPGSGSLMPSIKTDGSGDVPLTTQMVQGQCTETPTCGCGSIQRAVDPTGQLVSASIKLYTKDSRGVSCDPSSVHVTLAHEIGHAYGLANSSCTSHIMGPLSPSRTVQPDECSGVEGRWKTPTEQDVEIGDKEHPCSNPRV